MRTNPIGGPSPYKTVWWKVDLGGVYNTYNIIVLFKNYDGYGIQLGIPFKRTSCHSINEFSAYCSLIKSKNTFLIFTYGGRGGGWCSQM